MPPTAEYSGNISWKLFRYFGSWNGEYFTARTHCRLH